MKTVAVLGASIDREKFGNKAVRAFRQCGYTVFPVNPRETVIEECPALPAIGAIQEPISVVSAYLPPPVLLRVLPEVAAKGCDELWLNPGTDSAEVLAEAQRLGLRVRQVCSIRALGLSPAAF